MHWKAIKRNMNIHFNSHILCEIDEGNEGVVNGPWLAEVLRGWCDGDICDVREAASAVDPL